MLFLAPPVDRSSTSGTVSVLELVYWNNEVTLSSRQLLLNVTVEPLEHFLQMFYPYVTISAAQAHESDDLRHAMSPFSLFLSSFSGAQRILGYVRP